MKVQQVLCLLTDGSSLRSEVQGWNGEDPRKFIPGKPVGYSGPPDHRDLFVNWRPNTVFEALASGWMLLAPPTREEFEPGQVQYDWWLVREVEK